MKKSFLIPFLLVMCGFLSATGSPLLAQSASDVLSALRARYDGMSSMTARFNQTTTSTYLDETEHYQGEITLAGDAYRIEMPTQTIVSDTKTTWIYNQSENQVIVDDYIDDETTFSLSRFLREFDTAYRVENFETEGARSILSLIPSDPFSSFQSVTIWIRRLDTLVTRLDVVDVNDVKMRFDLSDIVFNPLLPDRTFAFVPPNNVEVIDLREN